MTTTDSGFVSGSQGKSPKRGEEKEDEEEGGIPGPAGTWGARGSAWPGPADSATPLAGGVTLQVVHAAPFARLSAAPSWPVGLLSDWGARLETSAWNLRPGDVGPGTEHSPGCVFTSVRRRDPNLQQFMARA